MLQKLIAQNASREGPTTSIHIKFLFPLAVPRTDLFWTDAHMNRLSIVMNLLLIFTFIMYNKWEKRSRSRNELTVSLFKIIPSRRKHSDEKSLKNSMKANAIIEHKSITTSKILASESDKTCSADHKTLSEAIQTNSPQSTDDCACI